MKGILSMSDTQVVDTYLKALHKLLMSWGVSSAFAKEARDNVGMQICSVLAHWSDESFRNTLLVIGREEGESYVPFTPINPFVVVTVRNSLLETLHSVNHLCAGLKKAISPAEIKRITQQAIRHFSVANLDTLSKTINIPTNDDCYGHLPEKYPLAWEALHQISTHKETVITYTPVHPTTNMIQPDFQQPNTFEGDYQDRKRVVLDGYATTIDERLQAYLTRIHTGELDCLFVDSFKMLTRNAEKLLYILNFVLANDGIFFTSNYYITNGYIEQRSVCLPPTHSSDDPFSKARQRQLFSPDIGKNHENALRSVMG